MAEHVITGVDTYTGTDLVIEADGPVIRVKAGYEGNCGTALTPTQARHAAQLLIATAQEIEGRTPGNIMSRTQAAAMAAEVRADAELFDLKLSCGHTVRVPADELKIANGWCTACRHLVPVGASDDPGD